MALNTRSRGSELSVVEREIACNNRYEDVGYVQYDTKDGHYFYLHPSPFLPTARKEIYYAPTSPPPEYEFVEVEVSERTQVFLDRACKDHLYVKTICGWKPFDITPLATRRKNLDFMEIIDYFTYPYKGEADIVQEVATCSTLFAFSSPPITGETGGIKTAVFGKNYQWDLFQRPLKIIPPEFKKISSEYYYSVSKTDRRIRKTSGEINQAILRPEKMVSDLPVVIDETARRTFSKGHHENHEIEAGVIIAQVLDGLLLKPESSDSIGKMMGNVIYELRDEYLSAGQVPFNQNVGDAVPRLASSYARVQSNPEIRKEDVRYVVDMWSSMFQRAGKLLSYPMKTHHMYELTGEGRRVYFECYDVFGADYNIPITEAMDTVTVGPVEFELAVDSLVEKGYCKRSRDAIMLLEPCR
ncbi:hypothetical protein J2129_000359 [Methanofollis sp. W23]|uniref:hypothetical protein n=1 Tax=Methanofollis sp. W23 TaxID=2817849 RepID=UPI001AE21909|nr:hypothetical protein [Methanofollis sp. W23]MBP2144905.1 hypothetical protein [Methanofollis sp. W23]